MQFTNCRIRLVVWFQHPFLFIPSSWQMYLKVVVVVNLSIGPFVEYWQRHNIRSTTDLPQDNGTGAHAIMKRFRVEILWGRCGLLCFLYWKGKTAFTSRKYFGSLILERRMSPRVRKPVGFSLCFGSSPCLFIAWWEASFYLSLQEEEYARYFSQFHRKWSTYTLSKHKLLPYILF